MPGYHLIEERMLKLNNPDGIEPHPNRKGFLDVFGASPRRFSISTRL